MKKRAGFTLIELMVVIAIIGIMILIMGPPVNRWLAQRGVHEAAVQLAESLQRAKLLAIRQSANSTLTVNVGTRQYTVTSNNPVSNEVVQLGHYRGDVIFTNDPQTGAACSPLITFTPQGFALPSAAGGNQQIVLTTVAPGIPAQWYRIIVSVAGGISIHRWSAANNRWYAST
jgi:prepilin-type N-terminal cleavage/methylation domain-containing protein